MVSLIPYCYIHANICLKKSSALVIGINESMSKKSDGRPSCNIWRIDPTGQFWNCQAAAVGRGAGIIEGEMMKLVYKWKCEKTLNGQEENQMKKNDYSDCDNDDIDMDKVIESISNYDVQQCLRSLSFDDVVKFACDCIRKVHEESNIATKNDNMIGVQGILITKNGEKHSRMEVIHPSIIEECHNTMVGVKQ